MRVALSSLVLRLDSSSRCQNSCHSSQKKAQLPARECERTARTHLRHHKQSARLARPTCKRERVAGEADVQASAMAVPRADDGMDDTLTAAAGTRSTSEAIDIVLPKADNAS